MENITVIITIFLLMIARSQQLIPVNYIEQFQSKNKNKNETTKIISN